MDPARNQIAVPQPDASTPQGESPLAIICGGGSLPLAVAQAVERRGRNVVLFPVQGWADPSAVTRFAHHWIKPVTAGVFLKAARAEGCRDVVIIGTAVRPAFSALRVDFAALRLLPAVWRAYRGGDDHLLSGVAKIFEENGFRILGAHEVAPEILMPIGSVGRLAPTGRDLADIARGLQLLRAMGPFDVGQAAVVADNHVLAVEAAEGTDNMLARIVELRERGRIATPPGVGVLVKAPKPQQDRRIDLPAIGPRTVAEVARAQLAGIAVAAGSAIVAEPADVATQADLARVFVFGAGDDCPPR
jgi:UDP-2,3-diacylglucosamine hydrolase